MFRRAVLLLTATVIGCGADAGPALADWVPLNCTSNSPALRITKGDNQTYVRPGDQITYTLLMSNDVGAACDFTDGSVSLTLPGHDGKLSTVPTDTLAINTTPVNLSAGAVEREIGHYIWTVAVDPGVIVTKAQGNAEGAIHDSPLAVDSAEVHKSLSTAVTQPHMTLTKTASATSGVAPLTVTYTYTAVNDSSTNVPIAPPTAGDRSSLVTDSLGAATCAPVTYTGGDGNSNGLFDTGETWTFTCVHTHAAAGCYTNTAQASGTSTVDNRPVPSGPASATVCLTAPPQPKGGVKAASACVSVASQHLKVRAREINTVRVRVRVNGKNIAKSKVRITGPAGLKRTGVTNRKGVVIFRVRPRKTGRLTITSDQCAVKARVSVKPARRVIAPALPEVTG